MIHYRAIGFVLGQFLLALAAMMLVPMAYALYLGGEALHPFVASAGITASAGGLALFLFRRPSRELSQREGLLLVVSIWLSAAVFGSLPFHFSGLFATYTDSFFESVSGFTTTGATILNDVTILPRAIQFWRCFTHWIGGMGIVVLGIAILPLVGHGGMQLYRAEFSGAKSERLKPRIRETAMALSWIYLALTLLEFLALRWAGMNNFEAACHTFSTLGTGGFSTRNESIGGFHNPTIELIVIFFMLLAGMSFVQHYRLLVERRPKSFFSDVEVRAYLILIATTSFIIGGILVYQLDYALSDGMRRSLFQVTSIVTTTGFVTDNFELWPPLPQLMLLAMMFVGGCTGSTAGGMKTSRIALLVKVVDREFKRMVERHGVFTVRLGGQAVSELTIQSLLNLVYLAFVVNFVSCILLAAMGVDVLTAIAAVAASMFNVGPGLGSVGPAETYAHMPLLAKWVLSGCMIAGRLEFYTILVILTPAFWRK